MKSNKKLFAILTLVAFMMTLAPLAAFGVASPFLGSGTGTFHALGADAVYSTTKTTVSVSGASVEDYFTTTPAASATETAAKFTLTFKDASGTVIPNTSTVDFTIQTTSDLAKGWVDLNENGAYDAGEEFTAANIFAMSSADGLYLNDVPLNANSQVLVYLGSTNSVSFDVKFFNYYEAGSNQIGSTRKVSVEKEDGAIELKTYATDSSGAAETTPAVGTALALVAGVGFDLRAEVPGDEEDVEVTFKVKEDGGTWSVVGTSDTDDDGIASLFIDAEKAGTFFYKADADGDDSNEIKVIVTADATANQLELSPKTDPGKKVAVNKAGQYVEFYVKDEFGNLVKNSASNIEVSISSAPSDSDLEDEVYAMQGTNADGVIKFSFKPDVVGKYVAKAKVTGVRETSTIEFEAVKAGAYESLKFTLKNAPDNDTVTALTRRYQGTDQSLGITVETNAAAGKLLVYGLTNGAELEINPSDLTFTSSNNSHVAVDTAGLITVKAAAAGTYQITVYYADDNLLAVYDLKVVKGPSAIKATPAVNGSTAAVTIQYIDAEGNDTYANSYAGVIADEAYTVVAPAGVTVSDIKNISSAGKGSFNVSAAAAGTYKVTVLTSNKKIGASFDITLGTAAGAPVIGAKKVTMFIGATGYVSDGSALVTDVAPFIVDGRTFVAVRPVADAFGAEIGWNEATQTVTLTRADATITIVIGSNTLTVVKGGVTSTITADVAAFIKDGRTVLPFRAVGEAFGAEVSYDAATQAVTYEQ